MDERKELLRTAVACCDLTTLEPDDDAGRVRSLARKALQPSDEDDSVPHVAALCTWWHLTRQAAHALDGSNVLVAAVAGDFPQGKRSLADKLAEVEAAVGDGADEIDVVINRRMFLSGDTKGVYEETVAQGTAAGAARLKVILETGELGSSAAIRRAAVVAMAAGADMIKTSTGKMNPGATPQAALVMADAIADFEETTGRSVGLKVSGGIRSADSAMTYMSLFRERRGEMSLNPKSFRIGASSLLDAIVGELVSS